MRRECGLWAAAFALEEDMVVDAVAAYVQILSDGEGRPPNDTQIARALSRMRKGLTGDINSEVRAPIRAEQLDAMIGRLDSSIARTEVLETAGVAQGLTDIRPRLQAGRTLLTTLRAAVARRAR